MVHTMKILPNARFGIIGERAPFMFSYLDWEGKLIN
jgi:hypothetical protein